MLTDLRQAGRGGVTSQFPSWSWRST